MTETIKVVVRARPRNEREKSSGGKINVKCEPRNVIVSDKDRGGTMTFSYDHVLNSFKKPTATQIDVFNTIGVPILNHAFNCKNTCVFAYGQTSSGKTYTMVGNANVKPDGSLSSKAGLIPRVVKQLFERISKETIEAPTTDADAPHKTVSYTVEFGYIEIYCENITDLLANHTKGLPPPVQGSRRGSAAATPSLKVISTGGQGPYVQGAERVPVSSFEDLMKVFQRGTKNRKVSATAMNAESSRSHMVATIFLTKHTTGVTGCKRSVTSQINLVDLAGSERISKSKVTGQGLKEAKSINVSLSALGTVIKQLIDSKPTATAGKSKKKTSSAGKSRPKSSKRRPQSKPQEFASYRSSVLTSLLKESIGGNSMTYLMAAISPTDDQTDETVSTLRFAQMTAQVTNNSKKNVDPNEREIAALESQIEALKSRLADAERGGTDGAETDPAEIELIRQELTQQTDLAKSEAKSWQDKARLSEEMHLEMEEKLGEATLKIQEAERRESLERAKREEAQELLEKEREESQELLEKEREESQKLLEEERKKAQEFQQNAMGTAMKSIAHNSEEFDELRTELFQARQNLTQSQSELNIVGSSLQTAESQIDDLKATTAAQKDEIEALKAKCLDLQDAAEATRSENAELAAKLAGAKEKAEGESRRTIQAFEEIDRIREESVRLLARNEELVAQNARNEQANLENEARLKEELDNSSQNFQTSQENLANANVTIAEQEARIRGLQSRIKSLQTRLKATPLTARGSDTNLQ